MTRRELKLASEIVTVAKTILSTSSLDGLNRRQALRTVSDILSRNTKGFFTDESWTPVNAIWKALTDAGIDWTLEKTFYDHNTEDVPTSKTWKFKVDFTNDRGRQTTLWGIVTASGAGTVQDPLGRYDLVAYVS